MSEQIKVEVANSTILELVQSAIKSQLVDALQKNHGTVVEQIVKEALGSRVTRNYRDKTILDWAISDAITEMTKEVMQEWMKGHRKEIQAAFKRYLSSQGAGSLSNAIVGQLADGFDYRFAVEVRAKN